MFYYFSRIGIKPRYNIWWRGNFHNLAMPNLTLVPQLLLDVCRVSCPNFSSRTVWYCNAIAVMVSVNCGCYCIAQCHLTHSTVWTTQPNPHPNCNVKTTRVATQHWSMHSLPAKSRKPCTTIGTLVAKVRTDFGIRPTAQAIATYGSSEQWGAQVKTPDTCRATAHDLTSNSRILMRVRTTILQNRLRPDLIWSWSDLIWPHRHHLTPSKLKAKLLHDKQKEKASQSIHIFKAPSPIDLRSTTSN